MATETYHEYSAGSSALPWRGWYENEDGDCVAFRDLAGNVYRLAGVSTAPEGEIAARTAAWNSIWDQVQAACEMPLPDSGETDYWPKSNLACLLSMTKKEVDRRLAAVHTAPDVTRLEWMRTLLDMLFGAAHSYNLGAGPRNRLVVDAEKDLRDHPLPT